MTHKTPRVVAAIRAQPWAILPTALDLIVSIAGRDLSDIELAARKRGERRDGGGRTERGPSVENGIGILPLYGPIFPHANMLTDFSGASSLEIKAEQFAGLISNPAVEHVILDLDTPGGVAFGIGEFAEQVRAAQKPVTAYVGGMAASAGYWIASAARQIIAHPTALLGSIGVVTAVDIQEQPGQDGFREYEFTSSNAPNKRPDPRTEEGRAEIVATIDQLEERFLAAVAQYRGVSVETVIADFGAGGLKAGADAVAAGMADGLGSLDSVIAGIAGSPAASTGGPTLSNKGETSMPGKNTPATGQDQPQITAATLAADHPDIAEAFRDEGRAEAEQAATEASEKAAADARAEGAEAERQRIAGIQAHAVAGHEALIAEMIADGETTPDQAGARLLTAVREEGTTALADRTTALEGSGVGGVAPDPSAQGAVGDDAPSSDAPIEERAKAEWDKDAALRAEFNGNFDTYLAARTVEAANQQKDT